MSLDSISQLVDHVDNRFRESEKARFVLGITGPPGAGKSTVSELLRDLLISRHGRLAIVVPMDGYHLSNEELVKRNLRPLKGIPSTFDADGFVALVGDIKSGARRTIVFPTFDRDADAVVACGGKVEPADEIIIVEGNYLLMTESPWHQIRHYLDDVFYIDAPHAVLLKRLLERHMEGGMNSEDALLKVDSTDLPNAHLIEKTRHLATKVVRLGENGWQE